MPQNNTLMRSRPATLENMYNFKSQFTIAEI